MFSNTFLIKSASVAAIIVAGLLIVLKLTAWLWLDSLSLQASLIDSILDIAASIINFFVIRQALKPADAQHRFGHGKAEALGGIAQTMFIAGSAIWLLFDATHRVVTPKTLTDTSFATTVLFIAIILTFILIAYQRYVIKRTHSLVIAADSLHYQTDLLTNIGVLFGIHVASHFDAPWIDTITGASIAIYILITSYKIGAQSLDILMDRELSQEKREQIIRFVYKHPEVLGVHDLRTRYDGQQIFIQMHLDLDENMSLREAHSVGSAIAQNLKMHFPNADVIIHQDPKPQ